MNHYIENKKFLDNLIVYKNTKDTKVYNDIGKDFILIAKRLLHMPCFMNYTSDRKNEMVSDALWLMTKYLNKFDCERSNPFSYFTMVAYRAFVTNIKIIKKRSERFLSLACIDLIEGYDEDNCKFMSSEVESDDMTDETDLSSLERFFCDE